MGYQTINPATEENLALFPYKEKGAWKKDLERLYDGFISYQSVSFKIRKSYLMNLNKTLLERRDQLAEIISIEMGKPIAEARGEIEKCAWLCSFYANEAAGFLKDKKLKTNGTDNRISYGPLGIVFGIMPWNYPFWQVFRFACPALIAGNAVIIKHAPNVPQCAMAIEALFNQAGFTEELFQQWFIKVDDVAELIKDPRVRGVSLTGSESAGSAVGALAGKYIKPAVMELGGSDPFIVLKDADLEEAVKWGVASRMLNAGQSCIAAKRFIIHQDVYDEFVRLFVAKVKSLKLGDPLKIKTQIGPLARKDLLNNLNKQVSLSVKMGAKLKCGGSKISSKGFYFEPTVLTNVKSEMPVMKEEVFGPVAVFVKFKEEVEALLIANDTQYGLGASIWTKDKDKAITIASQIEAGSVFINQMVKSDPRLPFGGIKRSGYGRELAREGLLSFVNTKTISIN
jgi:succinate-semialdehyde dehydrogenase/glutarate-semialdehyde dehydrogenase